ncbi:winged helix-turn-helix domain-containing protein [Streptosporangium vulgare]|uniref:Winged helix-turn-helix domain-containing protein n=1 Tax=Streptosporangium vulgare TaxID=46190 RepID=A0ABV5TPW8_9ACTN
MTLYRFLMIHFPFANDETRHEQMYGELKRRIRGGIYKERYPIPSVVHLVQEFGVSRGTALKVTGRLADEGYVRPIPGRGTYVLPSDRWPQGQE